MFIGIISFSPPPSHGHGQVDRVVLRSVEPHKLSQVTSHKSPQIFLHSSRQIEETIISIYNFFPPNLGELSDTIA